MTLTQYKKIIAALPREELEAHLLDLFKCNKVFKDIESTTWDEGENSRLLAEYQKKIEKVFWKNSFSLSECKTVLKDFSSRTLDPASIALMYLMFASEAVELSSAYGDFGDMFYDALEKAAEVFLDYAKTDKKFFTAHADEYEHMMAEAADLGYGVQDDLETMYYDAREDLFGEEEE